MPPDRIRVAIADDHPIFRLGVRALLADEADMEIVEEASDGEAALSAVERSRPDVLLLDLNLPGLTGIEVLRRLESMATGTRTVLVSASVDAPHMRAAMRHGAHGVLLKHTASELLTQCIRQVARGEYVVAPGGVDALVGAMRAPEPAEEPRLTPRELDVIRGVVNGESNKQIAARLGISEQTVKNCLRIIFDKLKVTNRVELALYAVDNGLVGPPRRKPNRS